MLIFFLFRDVSESDYGPDPASFASYGPSNLRRLPRVPTTPPGKAPPPPPIATRNIKEDDTGRFSRNVILGFENKPRIPALFSVPSACPGPVISNSRTVKKVDTFSFQQKEVVYASLEEDRWDFKINGVHAVQDMANSGSSPGVDLLGELVRLLLKAPSRHHALQIHNVLMTLLHQHPPYSELPFEFDLLEKAMEQWLKHGPSDTNEAYRNYLALQYMVAALEADVLQRSLNSQHQLNRSLTFQWFCSNGAFHRVKRVLDWLVKTVSLVGGADGEGEQVFSLLDQLMDLALAVHHRPEELATKCAVDLQNEYLLFPSIEQVWLNLLQQKS